MRFLSYFLFFILSFGMLGVVNSQTSDSNVMTIDSILVEDSLAFTDTSFDLMDTPSVVTTVEEEVKEEGELRPKLIDYKTFEFYVLLAILLVFSLVKLADNQIYHNLFKRFLNTSLSVRPMKNVYQHFQLGNYVLTILFFKVAGLYLFYLINRWDLHPGFLQGKAEWLQMLFYIGCVTSTYVVKLSFLGIVGYIFDLKRFVSEYTFNILLVQQVLGIILYPFLWMIVFLGESMTKVGIVISIVFFSLAFLNRYARSRESIASLLKLNKFHFFIYLCTSEIIPLLIIIKIMIG